VFADGQCSPTVSVRRRSVFADAQCSPTLSVRRRSVFADAQCSPRWRASSSRPVLERPKVSAFRDLVEFRSGLRGVASGPFAPGDRGALLAERGTGLGWHTGDRPSWRWPPSAPSRRSCGLSGSAWWLPYRVGTRSCLRHARPRSTARVGPTWISSRGSTTGTGSAALSGLTGPSSSRFDLTATFICCHRVAPCQGRPRCGCNRRGPRTGPSGSCGD
jgi:hypothetical protein